MGPFKHVAFLCCSLVAMASMQAQTPAVFAVTMEYAPIPGYQYFFSRINSGTGTVEHVAELPVDGFYMGTAFMNYNENYLFVGRDSADATFKLYEVDTLGVVVNTIPATNSAGNSTNLLCAFQSRKCPIYYGISWDSDVVYELIKIDPTTGVVTVMASLGMPGQMSQTTFTMDGDDRLYFFMSNWMTGVKTLYRADAATGTIIATDSMPAPEHLFNLFYDCEADKVFGFHKNETDFSMQGSEWVEVDTSGAIVHSGTYISAAGNFWTSAFTTLTNGDYFQKNTGVSAIWFDPLEVSGSFFTPSTSMVQSGDHKLYAAVPTSCGYTYDCSGHTTGLGAMDDPQAWQLFPNPASDQVTLVLPEVALGAYYELSDLGGRRIIGGRISSTTTVLDIQGLAPGIYHVRIIAGAVRRTMKLVK